MIGQLTPFDGDLALLNSGKSLEQVLFEVLKQDNSRIAHFVRDSVLHKVDFSKSGTAPVCRRVGARWEVVGDLLVTANAAYRTDVRVLSVVPSPSGKTLLVRASRHGADCATVHEVVVGETGLTEGFFWASASKGGLRWQDENTVLAFVPQDESELTQAGHPRVVRLWRRGQPLSTAPVIAEVSREAVTVMVEPLGGDCHLITEHHTAGRRWFLRDDRGIHALDLPHGSQVWAGWDGVYASVAAGGKDESLIFLPADDVSFPETVLDNAVVVSAVPFERGIALVLLRDGQERLMHAHRKDRNWQVDEIGRWGGACTVLRADRDQVVASLSAPATPPYLVTCRADRPLRDVASSIEYRALGDAGYHLCRASESLAPTLVCVYGGFGATVRAEYHPEMYAGWLAHGFNLVLAHVRGGGENGVTWALAGQRMGKVQAADDLGLILRDLIDSGVSDRDHLACLGSSNGGLLAALTCIRHPNLLRSAVLNNALLDLSVMESTSAGRGWVEEYGTWSRDSASMLAYSPIHQLPPDCHELPEMLICSQVHDDRIPTHSARNFLNTLTSRGGKATLLEGGGSHRGPTDQTAGIHLLATIFRHLYSTII